MDLPQKGPSTQVQYLVRLLVILPLSHNQIMTRVLGVTPSSDELSITAFDVVSFEQLETCTTLRSWLVALGTPINLVRWIYFRVGSGYFPLASFRITLYPRILDAVSQLSSKCLSSRSHSFTNTMTNRQKSTIWRYFPSPPEIFLPSSHLSSCLAAS